MCGNATIRGPLILSKQQMLSAHKKQLSMAIADAIALLAPTLTTLPEITLERPKVATHGDIACTVALQIAKPLGMNPREFAQQLVQKLKDNATLNDLIVNIHIAGPGFLNFYLSDAAKQATVHLVLEQGKHYGQAHLSRPQQVMLEFVSANPTGPLHVGHGRQGALGDVLANLLASQGWQVHREFYYNDAGVQINTLANSVQARCQGFAPNLPGWPENAYNGDYIADIAADFLAKKTISAADGHPVTANGQIDDIENIRQFAVAYLRHEQDLDLQAFGIRFDQYYLESSLYTDGKVEEVVRRLSTEKKTYEHEGALWLRSTEYGDDKDRVMRKSDGSYTYFVPDVAYHLSKWQRGFTKVVNIQGSDHHGTIARVRAGLQGLNMGIATNYPDYVLHKMVTVIKDGAEVKISKRAGSYVTLRDLIEWTSEGDATLLRGRDAVRFFLISRKADTEFVFDVDLARQQNDENPVYYVQYAHARICSILTQWGGDLHHLPEVDLAALTSTAASALMQRLSAFPEMLAEAAHNLTPHTVAFYLRDLASDFHTFYNADRVLIDDQILKLARLALLAATRQVLRNGLAILGVSAPERM